MYLAAESHVDHSILLEEAARYRAGLSGVKAEGFRFHHISTDELFESLGPDGIFHQHSLYRPNSPYSASKAASDHPAHAWFHTYGLPAIVTNCSNNYGPHQFPEKLIPLIISRALGSRTLPVYSTGKNVRDWLHVEHHVRALALMVQKGRPGHDKRYTIDASKIHQELAWAPQEPFESGLARTVEWYLDNDAWCSCVLSGDYRTERLVLKERA